MNDLSGASLENQSLEFFFYLILDTSQLVM